LPGAAGFTHSPSEARPHVRPTCDGKAVDGIRAFAGLLEQGLEGGKRELTPLVFAPVHLPGVPPGSAPHLHSRLPARNWVFSWDQRREVGYLLAIPKRGDGKELRFSVSVGQPELSR